MNIQWLAIQISVRRIGTNRHPCADWALIDLYFRGETTSAKVIAVVSHEFHVVDNLKVGEENQAAFEDKRARKGAVMLGKQLKEPKLADIYLVELRNGRVRTRKWFG